MSLWHCCGWLSNAIYLDEIKSFWMYNGKENQFKKLNSCMYINLSIYKYMSSVAMCTIYAIYDIIRIRIPSKGLENMFLFQEKKCYSKYVWRKKSFEVI